MHRNCENYPTHELGPIKDSRHQPRKPHAVFGFVCEQGRRNARIHKGKNVPKNIRTGLFTARGDVVTT
ncbi:MAG: hypothetical protein ACLS4Z_08860 [Christensenellaceae bacterium]